MISNFILCAATFCIAVAVQHSSSTEAWVKHSKNGETSLSTAAEIETFLQYISSKNTQSDAEATSTGSEQMEDGPLHQITPEQVPPASEENSQKNILQHEAAGQYIKEVFDSEIYFYPVHAIGIMDNGCTAFLIGPRHALTTAHCVFNSQTRQWKNGSDLWRGRHRKNYLSKMEWSHIIIPHAFYTNGSKEYNWALITFTEATKSPVWLRIAMLSKTNNILTSIYGYLDEDLPQDIMYNTICRSNAEQSEAHFLEEECETDLRFNGGPVLRGYPMRSSKRLTFVYGISASHQYSYQYKIIKFDSNLFWLLCHLMSREGHDPECKIQ